MLNYFCISVVIYLAIVAIGDIFYDVIWFKNHWIEVKTKDGFTPLQKLICCCFPIIRWLILGGAILIVFLDYYDIKDKLN